ncbi:MAG TPA: magnesium-translocating P-type ATPase [Pyrinomonadaceae bacterium]|nr:magnesium-translocating P-type ATPase [Pyrinomonadaceae bacterium]
MAKTTKVESFWSMPLPELFGRLDTAPTGLSAVEAKHRLQLYGPNRLRPSKRTNAVTLLAAQFKSPLILILLVAVGLSFFFNESIDALIIIAIILLSSLLGFWQEKRAADAVKRLLSIVKMEATVLRDGVETDVAAEQVVPGDVCLLNAGDIVPGDAAIVDSNDLFVDEAALTGESFPAEKGAGVFAADTVLMKRTNSLFMGTHIVSGSASALITLTGTSTEFGKLSEGLRLPPAETEFEHGVRRFGYLLTKVTLVLVLVIFGTTVFLDRPVIESFLFALAIAVGIIPELLPAIISINLAVGAVHMARMKVIVKQLASIENLGSMNLLCVDKTGTLTEGTMRFNGACDVEGNRSERATLYAYLNAFYQTGFTNPIDNAIRTSNQFDISMWEKIDEVPYDFVRKRLSILVAHQGEYIMITKGAVRNVLDTCVYAEVSGQRRNIIETRDLIERQFAALGADGFRTLGLAYKSIDAASHITKTDESGMTFLGLLVFFDPAKEGVTEVIRDLKTLGITVKVITGDNTPVATSVARQVLGYEPQVVTGSELHWISNEALRSRANTIDVFAEIEPSQKERIIMALRQSGNTVGFLGDGINDTSALHAADVGISVNSAVDVAKEAAAVVLLEKDLSVLSAGVREGRRTFANTLKYIFMTTSANFGNMFSMAGAALFLPFLPLLPKQILLNNFLTDFPAMAIATDSVDSDQQRRPQVWNIKFIRNFMIIFGLVSSIFDFLTFGALTFVLKSGPEEFRTGWFVESVMTEVLIIVVMRTWQPFYKSRVSRALLIAMVLVLLVTLALPYSPLSGILGFTPLSGSMMLVLGMITLLYVTVSEIAKRIFLHIRAKDSPEHLRTYSESTYKFRHGPCAT